MCACSCFECIHCIITNILNSRRVFIRHALQRQLEEIKHKESLMRMKAEFEGVEKAAARVREVK